MNLSRFKNQWLPACTIKELSRHPKRFLLLGVPILIFRQNKQIIALQDRCPHRGAPLSAGTLDGEVLQCAYHGWRFNMNGECVAIPGLTKKINLKNKKIPTYQTQVYANLVFVCLEKDEHTSLLYSIPALQTKNYHYHHMQFNIQGSILNIIENTLDATHTHFVHSGLLRHDSKRQSITATLTVSETNAEVLYEGEKKQSGLISSIFENNRNYSIGRFHFPLIAEIEYHGHKHLSAAFTFYLSPTSSANEHRAFLIISYRKSWLRVC
ncbi:aromatic ring-hydroxylating oxygenase subunit alpha [Legionella drancourtii]|uniref:Rieske domain-containing protein n=1 Tax=Legionella drancourtii LLAP12 TaxID=658187 RepID=G9ENY5_9GAMM|nr:aromatic ring-hydroxylating dioxygenase subunit alpha [Legionella drancourtii]EHL31057.1 hypothetical protein LDG_6965 [Legionella drancourtii LLAP12]